MFTRISSTRRRVVVLGSGVLLLGAAGVTTAVAVSSGGSGHTPSPSHRYADYLDDTSGDSSGSDQCALPVAQRTGGWVCPAAGGQK